MDLPSIIFDEDDDQFLNIFTIPEVNLENSTRERELCLTDPDLLDKTKERKNAQELFHQQLKENVIQGQCQPTEPHRELRQNYENGQSLVLNSAGVTPTNVIQQPQLCTGNIYENSSSLVPVTDVERVMAACIVDPQPQQKPVPVIDASGNFGSYMSLPYVQQVPVIATNLPANFQGQVPILCEEIHLQNDNHDSVNFKSRGTVDEDKILDETAADEVVPSASNHNKTKRTFAWEKETPCEDPDEEKKRLNAIKARKNRIKKKNDHEEAKINLERALKTIREVQKQLDDANMTNSKLSKELRQQKAENGILRKRMQVLLPRCIKHGLVKVKVQQGNLLLWE